MGDQGSLSEEQAQGGISCLTVKTQMKKELSEAATGTKSGPNRQVTEEISSWPGVTVNRQGNK